MSDSGGGEREEGEVVFERVGGVHGEEGLMMMRKR